MSRVTSRPAGQNAQGQVVLCEKAIQDVHSGRYSLIGVFRQVGATGVPVPMTFSAYVAATGTGDMPLTIGIYSESGEMIACGNAVPASGDHYAVEAAINFGPLSFSAFGVYRLRLYLGSTPENCLAETEFSLVTVAPPETGA